MVHRRVRTPPAPALDFAAIRAELKIPRDFPPEVIDAAQAAASRGPDPAVAHADRTDIEFVTIDPPGSMDLDQAVAVEERPTGGWTVRYAIADVGAWVTPDGPIDVEARARTQTYYSPDQRAPLHPHALGEAAASLLPDGPRPAALWTIQVAPDGTTDDIALERAMVQSRARLTYEQAQADVDAGRAHPAITALPALGVALMAGAQRRGAIELGLADQEVVAGADGHWTLELRQQLPIEHWNAHVSLLTGRAAATLMLGAGRGLLRTLPAADRAQFPRLRRAAQSLGIAWPEGAHPGTVLAGLDTCRPKDAAFAELAAELLRGAGYAAFDGEPPTDPGHAGVGAPYAHVTAPLRRLGDRFVTELCLSIVAASEPPAWLLEALPQLPDLMSAGDQRGHALERAVVDATEAFVLADRVGDVFEAAVVETGEKFGTVALKEPAVRGRCDAPHPLPLGVDIHVRCTEADVTARRTRFERVS